MAGHAQLKFVITECSKTQIRLTGLIYLLSYFNFSLLARHFCSEGNTKKDGKKYKNELLDLYMKILAVLMKISHKKNGLPSLHIRRMRTMAIEVFKILNEMCPPVLANLVEKRSSSYNFRYSNILQVPTVHTSTFGK